MAQSRDAVADKARHVYRDRARANARRIVNIEATTRFDDGLEFRERRRE